MKIRKREGYCEEFNRDKIMYAVAKAFEELKSEIKAYELEEIVADVELHLFSEFSEFTVEDVQDTIEDVLIRKGFIAEAKAFIRYRQERTRIRNEGWKLDDLQMAIWEKKYRHGSENFEEWLERVSGGNHKIAKLIRQKKFTFAGRILAHRGLGKLGRRITYSNCFYPGTKVLTKSGYKPIEQIQKGEYVLTGDGTYQKVNETMVSDFSGELIVFDKSYTNNTIKTTPNHKFLTQKGWKTAEEIYIYNNKEKKKQYCGFLAKPSYPLIERTYDIKNLLEEKNRQYIIEENFINTITPFEATRGKTVYNSHSKGSKMFAQVKMNEDVLYLLGRYLGDGSLTIHRATTHNNPSIFQLVFNAKTEKKDYIKCKKIIEENFGVTITDNSNKNQNTLVLKVNNEPFCLLINSLVGRGENKHFPVDYKNNLSVLLGLLDADGYLVKAGNSTAVRLVLKNTSLFKEALSSLQNNGFNIWNEKKIQHGKDKKYSGWCLQVSARLSYRLIKLMTKEYEDNRHIVKEEEEKYCLLGKPTKEKYVGPVYNLSVENNHEYYVEGILAHNCYVMTPPEDNIESIFETAKELARTYSAGGGCGVDISKLRPMGMAVNNSARTTSGATSFMSLYDLTTGLIGQNGRRGALMLSIDVSHPEVEDFIDIKAKEGSITKANISLKVDDKFMEAVLADSDYLLHWEGENGLKMKKTIRARDVYMKNVQNNWDWAEAGFLFWDRIKSSHMMSSHPEHEFAGVNPCLHPDSMIETVEGRVRIADIKEPIGVYTMLEDGSLGIKTASPSWISKKDAQTINVTTKNGKTIRVTPDHKVMTHNGWVEAKDLKIGDRIVQLLRRRRGVAYSGVRLTTQKNGTDVMEHRLVANYATPVTKEHDVHHIDGNTYNNTLSNLQVLTHSEHSTLTRFSCDNNHQIHGENGDFVCGNGEYQKTIIPMPIELQSHMINQHCNKVVSIELGDITDVYDITVEDTHNFVADYMVVHNCAEEPLMANGSCLLGSINLSEFVVHPFTDDAYFDYNKFKSAVATAVTGLNEVLDEGLPLHPLQGQRENARDWRQIGLGVMGIADMFIKLGIRYGSIESLKVSNSIARRLANSAIRQSAILAKQFGEFPKFDLESLLKSKWFMSNCDDDTFELVIEHGLRNSQLLTIAPTGSISTMWGISGGIEPIFAASYKRKTESIYGTDVYFDVYTPIVKELIDKRGEKAMKEIVVTSHDLDWRQRIEMQSVWQAHIDASISSTVNLNKNTTVEECGELFIEAWKSGLKGITIFRDGCKRTGILTTDEDDAEAPEKIEENSVYSEDKKFSVCEECGEPIEVIQGACSICMNCGHSGCS